MSDKNPFKRTLWTDRSVEETVEMYTDWADSYEADVSGRGYCTPFRMAEALKSFRDDFSSPILDFGCGTGFSGTALVSAGFHELHGTDITPDMLKKAEEKQIYQKLWIGTAGAAPAKTGEYSCIFAAGVISLGAAPPSTLTQCLDALESSGLLVISFNQPTVEDGSYNKVLDAEVSRNRAEIIFHETGPHFDDIDMTSDVIILRRK